MPAKCFGRSGAPIGLPFCDSRHLGGVPGTAASP
jgi:hypothetical protein